MIDMDKLAEPERYGEFWDGWGDEFRGMRQHPKGEWVKYADIKALLDERKADKALMRQMAEALEAAKSELHINDREWNGGNFPRPYIDDVLAAYHEQEGK